MNNFPTTELQKSQYPALLQEIPDAPKKLYLRGALPQGDYKYLTIVGSRKYTDYGKAATEKLIAGLRGYRVVIVSGLALGIDAIAHKAALAAKLPTIAIPGSGLDDKVLYPSSHLPLARKILEEGGALLSEFKPDFKATPYSFPQRNRVMAGIAHATLVIEAEKISGTLITSKHATDYNRDVLTLPGPIFSKTSEGPLMLLRLGATPVGSSKDILEALHINREGIAGVKKNYENLSETEQIIVETLSEPLPREELIALCGISAKEINTVISIMEIKGIISEKQGKLYLE